MGITNRGEGEGQGPTCRNAHGHIIESSDLEKMYCRCLNFDSLELGFYPDAGFLFSNFISNSPKFTSLSVFKSFNMHGSNLKTMDSIQMKLTQNLKIIFSQFVWNVPFLFCFERLWIRILYLIVFTLCGIYLCY